MGMGSVFLLRYVTRLILAWLEEMEANAVQASHSCMVSLVSCGPCAI